MALTDENGGMNTTMLVSPAATMGGYPYPVYAGGQSGGTGGWDNGNGWWIILLFILLASGNWGGNQYGQGGGFGGQPIIVNDSNGNGSVQRGFDQAAIMSGIAGVQTGVQGLSTQLCGCCGDVQTSLCNGFAGVNATVNSGFANAETAANARQMANMNQAFAAQTAMSQGFNALGTQFADCCCENRLASADLKYTIATENCADRAALSDALRDVMAANSANTQRILDQLCADKIEQKNDTIAQLRQELMFARGQASQDVQTAAIQAGQRGLANEIEQYVLPTPRPAYIVQNPNCCAPNYGCGCGA